MSKSSIEIAEGASFNVTYPFVKGTFSEFDGDGYSEAPTWTPGVRFEDISPEDVGSFADGEGAMTLTVVSVHKPGKYPTRVFYTRRFATPDGKVFGKSRLHIATADKFRRLCNGYRHEYTLVKASEERAA
jgi:hypothetical protein